MAISRERHDGFRPGLLGHGEGWCASFGGGQGRRPARRGVALGKTLGILTLEAWLAPEQAVIQVEAVDVDIRSHRLPIKQKPS